MKVADVITCWEEIKERIKEPRFKAGEELIYVSQLPFFLDKEIAKLDEFFILN